MMVQHRRRCTNIKPTWVYHILLTVKLLSIYLVQWRPDIRKVQRRTQRDVMQWLERGAWSILLYLPWGFEYRLLQDFQRNITSYWGHCFDAVSLGKALNPQMLHWTQVEMSPGRTEMTLCMISSMHRNGCRTVCFSRSWNGIRMNKWQGDTNVKVGWKSWYQTINLHHFYLYTTWSCW